MISDSRYMYPHNFEDGLALGSEPHSRRERNGPGLQLHTRKHHSIPTGVSFDLCMRQILCAKTLVCLVRLGQCVLVVFFTFGPSVTFRIFISISSSSVATAGAVLTGVGGNSLFSLLRIRRMLSSDNVPNLIVIDRRASVLILRCSPSLIQIGSFKSVESKSRKTPWYASHRTAGLLIPHTAPFGTTKKIVRSVALSGAPGRIETTEDSAL